MHFTKKRGHQAGVRAQDAGHDDHHLSSRRKFLRQLGLITTGTALLPGTAIEALGSSKLAQALLDNPTDRVLILIRLKGGNDGLNTIVPLYDYQLYRSARPTLAYQQNELINLTNELAVSQDFASGFDLWQQGKMRVVNGVGYPDHSLSHFRSTDIMATASEAQEVLTSGWLGRHLDECFPDYLMNPPSAPPAIQIGGAGSLTFNNDENLSLAVTVNSVEELRSLAETGELYDTTNLPDCFYGDQLGYLRSIANSAFVFADGIEGAYESADNAVAYPSGQLGAQLALVARLIKGGLDTRMFMVTLDGFDTHAGQDNNHPQLLRHLGDSVKAFYDDLATSGDDQRVLSTTFSEFGRRIEQNASSGTDHGTAAPQLLFGPALSGNGAHGDNPSLSNPNQDGNLRFTTDFRAIYATLLEGWLCVPGSTVDSILGGSFARLDLGFDCLSVSTSSPQERFATSLQQTGAGWALAFESDGGSYQLDLVDTAGRTLSSQNVSPGFGNVRVELEMQTTSGVYAYRLTDAKGRIASGLIPMLRR